MCARSIKWVLFTCASETTLLAMTESYILKEVTVKMPEFSIGNMPLSTDRIKILSSFQLAYQWYQRAFMFRWTSAWLGMAACLAVGRICWSHLIVFVFPLKQHMREAAERRQQLELEHEQALAVLNAKQQEIELLQKVSGERESQVK